VPNNFLWWRDGIIYQIYPRSFADSNGDGIGDLPGITARLDYLADLGIDAIWLSPFYPTPDADFGYDISNYIDVDPRFGTLADFDELVAQAHQRNVRVVLDMVMNHTSDQHPWFVESRSSRDNPKRDWYIWQDGKPSPSQGEGRVRVGAPPTNWQASFGGSAWEFDPASSQYYLHSFLKEQPDVNWRNPEVRKAQLDVFRFWLKRSVDGFRLDVFNAYFKDDQFRDNPPRFGLRGFDRQQHIYDMDQSEMVPLLQELRALLDSYSERYAVGETYIATPEKITKYAGGDRLHAAFSFDFTSQDLIYPWNARFVMEKITQRDKTFDAASIWPTIVMSNHDLPRAASRYARGEDDHQPLISMALLLTLRGTPFMYYGEEIGMRDISLKRSEILDPPGKKYWPVYKGRDGCRSPMQWSNAPFAGFSSANPWLPLHPDFKRRNVAAQQANPNSLFHFTRRLIALRRAYPALHQGAFRVFFRADTGVLAFERTLGEERILVYINFVNSPRPVSFVRDADPEQATLLLSSAGRKEFYATDHKFVLKPYEVLLMESKVRLFDSSRPDSLSDG
jgi:alpha-glucosidase